MIVALLASMALVLTWPAASSADHLTPAATVKAQLDERVSSDTWNVRVRWDGNCQGATDDNYQFQLNLVDIETGERFYVGGGPQPDSFYETTTRVIAREREQHLRPELEISCFQTSDGLHGSHTIIVTGDP